MTSQPGKQTIAIRILSNISQSRGNLTMKLGQFTEYSMRCIFLEISYTKYGGEAIVEKPFPNLFLKIQNWAYLWINSLKFYVFIACKLRAIKIY